MEYCSRRERYIVLKVRTDLASEAWRIWQKSAGKAGALAGAEAETENENGVAVETVRILDERGAKALGKPVGTYVSIALGDVRGRGEFETAAGVIASRLKRLLKLDGGDCVLLCGLGNAAIAADRIGPGAAEHTLATRHLLREMPEDFGFLRPVCVLAPGVLGKTGVESGELTAALVERVSPAAVIAVDALAARDAARLCRTVQLADTGIVPGSGIGNARAELSRRTLGVPVVAIGVPTVIDAATLAADLLPCGDEAERPLLSGMMVTPRDIDREAAQLSRLIGYGVNLALHDGLTAEDVTELLG